ncbi:MAG: RNA 2'-phosphotransferase [Phycisphaerae bacterium]|nr:RNA 2'-phosphotransferase [Phycisphaerae bacterium]
MPDSTRRISTFLSLVLRHDPAAIGMVLDSAGWVDVEELVACANRSGRALTREQVLEVVAANDKQRFALSEDCRRIRANQGHSISVDLGLVPIAPPEVLFHGTARHSLASILATGLHSVSRQHVHLSADVETALKVGRRHGTPVVLRVDTGRLHREGQQFFRSDNGVWLTSEIAAQYLAVLRDGEE